MLDTQQIDQNLLASSKRPPKLAQAAKPGNKIAPIRNRKRILKLAAYGAFGFFCFTIFFLAQLPEEVIVGNLLGMLNQQTPYYWEAKNGGLRFFLTPHLHFEKLTITPRFADASHPYQIDSLDLYPQLLRSFPWNGSLSPSAAFEVNYFGALLSGSVKSGRNMNFQLDGENIKLDKIPQLKSMSIDLKGLLSLAHVDLDLEQSHFARANGNIQMTGKSLLFDPTSLNTGLPIPALSIGALNLQAQVNNGKLQINRLTLGDSTHDLELIAEGSISLKDPVDFSDLDLRIRFRLADSVMKAVPSLDGMLGIVSAKRSDGFYGMKVSGNMSNLGMPTPMAQ